MSTDDAADDAQGLTDSQRAEVEAMLEDERAEARGGKLTRRAGLTGLAGLLGLTGATGSAAAGSSQAGSYGTEQNPGDFYAEDHFVQDQSAGNVETPPTGFATLGVEAGSVIKKASDGTTTELDASVPDGVITAGDGTERQIWVIPNGASDPTGAGPDDIIFEEEP